MVIRANGRLITKEDFGVRFLCKLLDILIIFSHPLQYKILVLLVGLFLRPLGAQSKFSQQAANGDFAQANVKLSFDQLSYHSPCPEGKFKFKLTWIDANNEAIQLLQLLAAQLWLLTRCLTATKGINATFSVLGKPLIDSTSCKPQGFYNNFRAFPSFNTLYGPDSNLFESLAIKFASVKFFHGRSITYVR